MKQLLVNRYWGDSKQSFGVFTVLGEDNQPLYTSMSLERGWVNNTKMVSCIPAGTYKIVLEYSNHFKQRLWELKGVPGRSECKIHTANYWRQLNGCIALGDKAYDLNNDGWMDITRSAYTIKEFHTIMGEDTEASITIIDHIL